VNNARCGITQHVSGWVITSHRLSFVKSASRGVYCMETIDDLYLLQLCNLFGLYRPRHCFADCKITDVFCLTVYLLQIGPRHRATIDDLYLLCITFFKDFIGLGMLC